MGKKYNRFLLHAVGEKTAISLAAAAIGLTALAARTEAATASYTFYNLGLADVSDPSSNLGSGAGVSNAATLSTTEVVSSIGGQAQYSVGGNASTNLGSNGSTVTTINGVNNGGVTVGAYTPGSTTEAFFTNGSSGNVALQPLPMFFNGSAGAATAATPISATAVNGTRSAFTAVGQATYNSGGIQRAFIWSSALSTLTPLDPVMSSGAASMTGLGAPVNEGFSAANGISSIASGNLVVGQATTLNTLYNHGFLFSPATNKMYDLGSEAGMNSNALGINSAGTEVVGTTDYVDPDGNQYSRAFIYTGYNVATVSDSSSPYGPSDVPLNGMMTDIGALDGTNSEAIAVNSNGIVVGYSSYDGSGFDDHAFVYNPLASTALEDLNSGLVSNVPSGFTLESATGVNDAGDITGYAIDNSGNSYAFLLAPSGVAVPEPAMGVVGLAGAALMSLRRRRRA